MEEKLLWRAYRKSPTLFRTVPSPTPYGLFLEIGGLQLATPSYLTNKSYGLQTCRVHLQGQSELKSIKNFGENGAWVYPGTVQIFWDTPYYLGNW